MVLAIGHVSAQEAFMSLDAKSLGMGSVVTTTLSDSHAIYNNAAAVVFSPYQAQLSSSYFSQDGYNNFNVSGFARIKNSNFLQVGWRQYRKDNMAVDLGYSRRVNEKWAVGIVARYCHSKLADGGTADALAVDLSALYALPLENIGQQATLRVGAKLSNLGGYLADAPFDLPMNATLGAAFDAFITDAHEVTVGVDVGYYFAPAYLRSMQGAVGVEYNLMQLFQVRGGYHFGEKTMYNPNYASVGAGVRFMHLRLDFAYLFAQEDSPFNKTYSLSFGLDF